MEHEDIGHPLVWAAKALSILVAVSVMAYIFFDVIGTLTRVFTHTR